MHHRGRPGERIAPQVHRRRPGVIGAARNGELEMRRPHDRADHRQRHVGSLEDSSLLDVQLDECLDVVACGARGFRGIEPALADRLGHRGVGLVDRSDNRA